MVTQQIFLPMIPDSAPIVVNISQYDFDAAGYAGRLFFNLINNGAAYDMDGATAIFQGEKPDGTTFAYPATVVNASVVRVNVRQQMTVVSGRVVCQLILSNTDGQIGSFNIWLEVQPSSASGGDPSQTDIPALVAQAKEYADEAEQAAINAGAWSANPPYIGANGNWFVYDVGTTAYVDTGVYASGTEGSLWYTGTAVSGKDPTPTVFPTGIALAREQDMYLNKNEGAIYQCTLGGTDTVAKWAFVMTLSGGGGTSDYPDLTNKPQINGVTLTGNKTTSDLLISLNGLTDTAITSPSDGQLLTVVMVGGVPQFQNKDLDRSFVRYGGAKTFAQLTSSLLVAANEDKFFLCTDGGTLTSADLPYWTSTFNDGDVIPADAHIAVINVAAAGQPADYRFDDFGGYIDISGKADKTELPTVAATSSALTTVDTSYQFTGLSATGIYDIYTQVADGEDNLTIEKTVANGTTLTVYFTAPTVAQAAGNACKIKLVKINA